MLINVFIYSMFCFVSERNLRNCMLLQCHRIFTIALVALGLLHGQDGYVVFGEKLFFVDDETEPSKFIKTDQKLSFLDKQGTGMYYGDIENTGVMIDYTDIIKLPVSDESLVGDYSGENRNNQSSSEMTDFTTNSDVSPSGDYSGEIDNNQSSSKMTDFTTNSDENPSGDYSGEIDNNQSTSEVSSVTNSVDVGHISSPSTIVVLTTTSVTTLSFTMLVPNASMIASTTTSLFSTSVELDTGLFSVTALPSSFAMPVTYAITSTAPLPSSTFAPRDSSPTTSTTTFSFTFIMFTTTTSDNIVTASVHTTVLNQTHTNQTIFTAATSESIVTALASATGYSQIPGIFSYPLAASPMFIVVTVGIVCVSLFVVVFVLMKIIKKYRIRKSLRRVSSYSKMTLL